MKNKYVFVAVLLMVLTIGSFAISATGTKIEKKDDELFVVTSFYPVYIATLNVTDGIEGVQVKCLTQPSTGCVHDHQLTTQDMRLLEQADVFIVNGADMENYLDSIQERYPKLHIVETSEGVSLLESTGEHHHDHVEESETHEETHEHEEAEHVHAETEVEEEEHEHEEAEEHSDHTHNAHIWMNMENYCIQIGNIGNALIDLDKEHKNSYEANVKTYQNKVMALLDEGKELEALELESRHAVSTHEAFSYFVENFDWHIVNTINMDENTNLKASEVSEVIEAVQEEAIPYMFTEEIYGTDLSNVLKGETSCQTVVLDTLVTGEQDKDAYLDGMRKNIETLREVTGR